MKLGFLLLDHHGGRGGLENVLAKVVSQLKNHRVESVIYMMYLPHHMDFLKNFDQVKYIPSPKFLRSKPIWLPKFLYKIIYRLIVRFGAYRFFRNIASDNLDGLVILNISKRLLRFHKKIIQLKKKTDIPFFSWVHSSFKPMPKVLREKLMPILTIFDIHLAISAGVEEEMIQYFGLTNIELVYNPIDKAELIERDPSRFVYLGRISRSKHVHELITILGKLKGAWHLDILGSTGKQKTDIDFSQWILKQGLEKKITFHGWQTTPWSIINKAGVLLLNSSSEGFPLVLLEAMMRGIPCVAANCPVGPSEIIQPGINGWLYEMDDDEGCLQILQEILDDTRLLPTASLVQASVLRFETEHVVTQIYRVLYSYIH